MEAIKRGNTAVVMTALILAIFAAVIQGQGSAPVEGSITLQHERLKLRNDFHNPEDVVKYYCSRDASGFVWSGLLDSERRAFTAWREIPQQDSFFIARKYEVTPITSKYNPGDHALIEVKYDLSGIGDAHGTRMPPPQPQMTVTFDLMRINGQWKIIKPEAAQISPVVLESKFPVASNP